MNTEKKMFAIYQVTFPDGNIWVGVTSDISKMLATHCRNRGERDNSFRAALGRHDLQKVRWEIVDFFFAYEWAIAIRDDRAKNLGKVGHCIPYIDSD